MIKETALALGYEKVVFLDDAAKSDDVIGMCCDYVLRHSEYPVAVAAFGNNKTRLDVYKRQANRPGCQT